MEKTFSTVGLPPFYARYAEQVNHLGLIEALEYSAMKVKGLIDTIPSHKALYAYAEGKWTILELLNHMMDAERVFAYRALCFSRGETINLPAFDEDDYVRESEANEKTLSGIKTSMTILRAETIDLFQNFSAKMLDRSGSANNTVLTVRALGYLIAGHDLHHYNVLRERYLS